MKTLMKDDLLYEQIKDGSSNLKVELKMNFYPRL
jgi:hypothetical protein